MYKLAKIYDVYYAQHMFLHCFGGPFFQCCFPCPKKTCLVPTNQLAKASPNAVNTQQPHLTTLHSDLTTQQTWWILPMRGIRCRCLGFPQFLTGFSTGHFFLNQQKKKRGAAGLGHFVCGLVLQKFWMFLHKLLCQVGKKHQFSEFIRFFLNISGWP